MLYLDDKLASHPKILRAARRLGEDGGARALALFIEGLSYAKEHLTDGFIPVAVVQASRLVAQPTAVARVLVDVGLWQKSRAGFAIHDYAEWNKSAAEVKAIRRFWRDKKAKQRRRVNGEFDA